jgi:hypothetical protein
MGEEMSDDVITAISRLINEKRWYEAERLGAEHGFDEAVAGSAHFWFAYGLARELTGGDGEWEFDEAAKCPDFTMQMQGDMNRDLALGLARMRRFDEAFDLLCQAEDIFKGDANRLASIEMLWGRVEYLRGHFRLAEEFHFKADAAWRELGDATNLQWIMNNRFYWLKVQATMGLPMRRLYHDFLRSPEPREDRRKLARLYFRYGPAGVAMGNAFETVWPRIDHARATLKYQLDALDGMYGGITG